MTASLIIFIHNINHLKTINMYTVALNSDRVHLSLNGTPVETHMFKSYQDDHMNDTIEDAAQVAIGIVVLKAIRLNNGSVTVEDKSR